MISSTSIRRAFCISLAYVAAYTTAFSQTIENVRDSFDQSRQLMLIYYDLNDLSYKQEVFVVPHIRLRDSSIAGEYPFPAQDRLAKKYFSGDYGWIGKGGDNKRIIWDPLRQGFDQLSEIQVVPMIEKTQDAPAPRFWTIFWHGSNSAPFGIKIARLSRIGFFAGFRMGHLPPSHRYKVSDAGVMDYRESGVYEIGAASRLASFAATGGLVLQIARQMYAFVGGGYGKEQLFRKYDEFNLNYELVGSNWALHENLDAKGAFYDLGLTLRLRNQLCIEIGTGTVNFQSYQILGGIGYAFSKKRAER
ncbi:MAG: hypothetical protein DYG98_25515 [Haliscomenobacteraceae bacterium CHB4]|nr:hypothetical protein [Saprospiraceae bacterium]MCE7926418.1 hypothetical protein [Haliscomenobacteraceae bacterium CHB4]